MTKGAEAIDKTPSIGTYRQHRQFRNPLGGDDDRLARDSLLFLHTPHGEVSDAHISNNGENMKRAGQQHNA